MEISGDVRLSGRDRLRYLWANACSNLRTLGRGPATRAFMPDLARGRAMLVGQSPSRLLTELFIETELPKIVPVRRLNVAELGCGSGSMAYRLARIGYSGTYTGVDIHDRFRRDHAADFPFVVDYVCGDAHAFKPAQLSDLVLSVSTLEHIPNDSALIAGLTFVRPGGIEIHVVPSGPGLAVYLWHGFRQYTPASIVRRFGPEVEIIRLGGLGSFLAHLCTITIPDILFRRSLRKAAPGLYACLVIWALRIDRIVPVLPTAYAIVRRH